MGELILTTLLIGLAAYRGYRVLAMDTITEPLRARVLARDDQRGWRFIGDLFTCPWCIGWYYCAAGALTFGCLYDWHPIEGLTVWFAASTVCGLAGKLDS